MFLAFLGIFVPRFGAGRAEPLEKAAVSDQHADALASADPLIGLIHIPERLAYAQKRGLVGLGQGNAIFVFRILSAPYPARPGADLIPAYFGLQKRGGQALKVGSTVIVPVFVRLVFYGILQKPHPPPGPSCEFLHDAVFQKGVLKYAFAFPAHIHISDPARICPYLRYVTIYPGFVQQGGFRRNDAVLSVVDKAVSRNVKFKCAAVFPQGIILQGMGDTPDNSGVQNAFELGTAIIGVHVRVRRLPVFAVVYAIFTAEGVRIAAVCPELRFLHVDVVHAFVDSGLDLGDQVVGKSVGGHHVWDIRARHVKPVQDRVSVSVSLGFVPVAARVE